MEAGDYFCGAAIFFPRLSLKVWIIHGACDITVYFSVCSITYSTNFFTLNRSVEEFSTDNSSDMATTKHINFLLSSLILFLCC